MAPTHIFINDSVGLPIIISDFNALISTPKNGVAVAAAAQVPSPTELQSNTSSIVSHAYSSS
jgi:hypothetical protein